MTFSVRFQNFDGTKRSDFDGQEVRIPYLGGGFKYFVFSPLFGEDSHFDYIIFFKWVETTN